jgi:hypothetical protein
MLELFAIKVLLCVAHHKRGNDASLQKYPTTAKKLAQVQTNQGDVITCSGRD